MTKSQVDFYNLLSEDGKYVLKIVALKAYAFSMHDIYYLVQIRRSITQKLIKEILSEAERYHFITGTKFGSGEWYATPDFMVFMYPKLTGFDEEWSKVNDAWNYYRDNSIKLFRNCLYSLLFDQKKYLSNEAILINSNLERALELYSTILDNPEYEFVIPRINIDFLARIMGDNIQQCYFKLEPFSDLSARFDKIKASLSPQQAAKLPTLDLFQNVHRGNIQAAISLTTDEGSIYNLTAYQQLTQGNLEAALTLFEKGMKRQRAIYKSVQLPVVPHSAFFYLCTLLMVDSEISAPIMAKINKYIEKNQITVFEHAFKPIIYSYTNDKSALRNSIINLTADVKSGDLVLYTLFSLLSMYLANEKPNLATYNIFEKVVRKAYQAGYIIISYEASYVLKIWIDNAESTDLYNEIAQRMSYEPVISKISRQEEWEKSLNLLLGLGLAKTNTKSKEVSESSSRVVYFLNTKRQTVQPVYQSRQAKGWSKGRNIAMKSFYEGKTKDMTDQDNRIAKTIKHYSDYYGDSYQFTNKVFAELVGHPYVFLDGTTDVPVELIAAQPVIQVVKSVKGYSLTTDIEDISERIILVKETNTRYKVYDLTLQQSQILQILLEQKIVVPEAGKDKLLQLLGGFSKHMTVHSDLLATENKNINVKEVKPDTRIRVQLLPLGDGLKAELYAKPFGTHPPYCKPGKGGKVLIANENGAQLQVKRNLRQESDYADTILNDIQTLESLDITDDLIAFDDPMDSLHLLDILAAHQDKCIIEWPEGERFKIKGTVSFNNLSLKLKSSTNWFDLQGELKVDEKTVISLQQLLTLTEKSHDRFIELSPGEFLALSNELKKQLEELRAFSTSSKSGVQLNKFALVAMGDFFENVENLKTDKLWEEFRSRVENVKTNDFVLPTTLQAELRPYQEDGFRWMARLAEWEGGACLADDMGLGKTIQTLAILLHRASSGPAMVVCPVSVVGNWIKETERFAPTMNIKTLGNTNREKTIQALEAGDILITSYGLLQSEEKLFSEKEFSTIVLDEAHTIKNYATKTSKATMQLKAAFRVALTGTPLQNHLGEIWNLFNFVNPGLLGNLQHFTDTFIKPDNEIARKHLKKLITPFILRRTKSAVLDELPPKTEIIKKVQLSDAEMAFYEALRRQALQNIENNEASSGTKQLQVLAEITKLRQASCNPQLIDPTMNIGSSKMNLFLEIVDELIENKHRALVFSQFVTHLAIMRKALDAKGIKYQYLDGSTSLPEREKSVAKFQHGEGELFLISLKAGGLGLNLTAADYVIHSRSVVESGH
ncbi:MAG: DEAD/DEAH box helicase [Paludibacteraceae bacterium]